MVALVASSLHSRNAAQSSVVWPPLGVGTVMRKVSLKPSARDDVDAGNQMSVAQPSSSMISQFWFLGTGLSDVPHRLSRKLTKCGRWPYLRMRPTASIRVSFVIVCTSVVLCSYTAANVSAALTGPPRWLVMVVRWCSATKLCTISLSRHSMASSLWMSWPQLTTSLPRGEADSASRQKKGRIGTVDRIAVRTSISPIESTRVW
mmetsp:Transcript_3524/g.9812  ORF Transcript_3524/g.9812 Transcript_3524/m.9812 type:complete len:204 (+) Transcript_3524:357-968(+)